MKLLYSVCCCIALLLIPAWSVAHTGDGPHAGFLHGFFHPFSGLDHVLAMVAVGMWATQWQGRMLWILPMAFVVVMGLGGLLGMVSLPSILAEHGIMLSLLILGALLIRRAVLPSSISLSLIAVFALSHGYAHGNEMPADISLLGYASGFMSATLLLHLIGIGLALLLRSYVAINWMRFSGIMIGGYGGLLLLQSIVT